MKASANSPSPLLGMSEPTNSTVGGRRAPAGARTGGKPGGASTIVLVSACYEWELGNALANVPYWISPANAKMTNGSTLIQASTTFTTEPF